MTKSQKIAVFFAAVSVLAATLWVETKKFSGFIIDDAFISLRYAHHFMDGRGLTWNDGERVEGYSNLLWVLSEAALGRMGMDLVAAMKLLGFCSTAAAAVFVFLYFTQDKSWHAWLAGLSASLSVVLAGPILAWTTGGLEQPLVLALLGAAILIGRPACEDDRPTTGRLLLTGLPLGLLCLTRPEGVLFTVAWVVGYVVSRRYKLIAWRGAVLLSVFPVICYGGQLLFRLCYYHAWVSNTALIKLPAGLSRVEDGLLYTIGGLKPLKWLLLSSLSTVPMFLAGNQDERRRVFHLIVPTLGAAAFVVVVGGDIFPARRLLTPVIFLLVVLFGEGLVWLLRNKWLKTIGLSFIIVIPITIRGVQETDESVKWAKLSDLTEEYTRVSQFLLQILPEDKPLIAVSGAGALPYYTDWPAIDYMGLCDKYIATHPPKQMTTRLIAHQFGDGRYVLSRRPEIVFFGWGNREPNPDFVSPKEMYDQATFHQRYRLVKAEGSLNKEKLVTYFWVTPELLEKMRKTADSKKVRLSLEQDPWLEEN